MFLLDFSCEQARRFGVMLDLMLAQAPSLDYHITVPQ